MPKPLLVPLCPEFESHLTFQSYGPAPSIEGVWLHPLCKHRSSNGAFMEVLRLGPEGTQGLPTSLTVRQISISWADPGRVNAFHIHARDQQDELWTVVQGSLLVWLVDMREASATVRTRRSVLLSSDQPSLLYIPSGVAHGYKAGGQGAVVLYSMDAQFDPSNPNEGRIPWDLFGAQIWEDDRG